MGRRRTPGGRGLGEVTGINAKDAGLEELECFFELVAGTFRPVRWQPLVDDEAAVGKWSEVCALERAKEMFGDSSVIFLRSATRMVEMD